MYNMYKFTYIATYPHINLCVCVFFCAVLTTLRPPLGLYAWGLNILLRLLRIVGGLVSVFWNKRTWGIDFGSGLEQHPRKDPESSQWGQPARMAAIWGNVVDHAASYWGSVVV